MKIELLSIEYNFVTFGVSIDFDGFKSLLVGEHLSLLIYSESEFDIFIVLLRVELTLNLPLHLLGDALQVVWENDSIEL
jgi:hypothetical protein